jgi:enterochelin esterase-like enzyme
MDGLITSGELPPSIVIFAAIEGGPYADPECSDSRDGTEWIDRWVSQTLVPWVDATFRTIPTPVARTVMGSSKGGYCAASLLTHHPDLFANGISLSGYFVAGLASPETIGADLVFGQDPAYEQSQSPMLLVAAIAPTVRRGMFMVLEADPQDHVFGSQMLAFARALDKGGVAEALFPTRLGHSWNADRVVLPSALRLVAARQVALGLFGPR